MHEVRFEMQINIIVIELNVCLLDINKRVILVDYIGTIRIQFSIWHEFEY